jgi:hypothetical protein
MKSKRSSAAAITFAEISGQSSTLADARSFRDWLKTDGNLAEYIKCERCRVRRIAKSA